MSINILAVIGVSILVGFSAQAWKGRIGAAWGFFTLVVLAMLWAPAFFVGVEARPAMFADPDGIGWITLALIVPGGGGFVVWLILATTPSKK